MKSLFLLGSSDNARKEIIFDVKIFSGRRDFISGMDGDGDSENTYLNVQVKDVEMNYVELGGDVEL